MTHRGARGGCRAEHPRVRSRSRGPRCPPRASPLAAHRPRRRLPISRRPNSFVSFAGPHGGSNAKAASWRAMGPATPGRPVGRCAGRVPRISRTWRRSGPWHGSTGVPTGPSYPPGRRESGAPGHQPGCACGGRVGREGGPRAARQLARVGRPATPTDDRRAVRWLPRQDRIGGSATRSRAPWPTPAANRPATARRRPPPARRPPPSARPRSRRGPTR